MKKTKATAVLVVRCKPESKSAWRRAARACKFSLSAWVVAVLSESAKDVRL